jgi:hypothetical protein
VIAFPSSDESFALLHAAGWSLGDLLLLTDHGPMWLVTGTNGENVVEARAAKAAEFGYRGVLLEAERALRDESVLVSVADAAGPDAAWVRFYMTADAGLLELHYEPAWASGRWRDGASLPVPEINPDLVVLDLETLRTLIVLSADDQVEPAIVVPVSHGNSGRHTPGTVRHEQLRRTEMGSRLVPMLRNQ